MTRAGVRVARATVLAALLAAPLTACGASPTTLGPSGVDGLTIPTPSPDPADFGDAVANPWFPLAAGTVWTYRRDTTTGTTGFVARVLAPHPENAGGAPAGGGWAGAG